MSAFTDAIERNWPNFTIAPGSSAICPQCLNGAEIDPDNDEALQTLDEGSFSSFPCDSCGSKLGGDRFNAHAIHHEAFGPSAKQPEAIYHIDICVDCLMYVANGEEPDT